MKEIGIGNPAPSLSGRAVDPSSNRGVSRTSFKDFLKDSIQSVDGFQKEAQRAVQKLAAGETENIHDTMIALKKAELSFKMMMQVRNKIVQAYQEVMRMQV